MDQKVEGRSREQRRPTDIKSITQKATGLLQGMNDRRDMRDKNYRVALEQQFISVQPSWPAYASQQQPPQPRRPALEAGPVRQQAEAQPGGGSSSSSSSSSGAAAEQGGAMVARRGAAAAAPGAGGTGGVLQVEREAALMSPYIQKEVVHNGMGLPGAPPVVLPKQVTADSWTMVLDYCRFHLVPGRSDKERRMFDERFIKVDTNLLCELTSAADALDMRPLVDLASRAIAKMIEGKSPDQIREAFRLPDDLTDEEKLEPLRTVADDPRIRMLNRLYARKRKELQERKAQLLQAQQQAQVWQAVGAGAGAGEGGSGGAGGGAAGDVPQDPRSLDELLSFIEDDSGAGRSRRGSTRPGKGKRKKAKQKAQATAAAPEGAESPTEPSLQPPTPAVTGEAAAAADGAAAAVSAATAVEAAAFSGTGMTAAAVADAEHLVPPEPQPSSSSAAPAAACSPASTLPTGSTGGSCRTTSGRSSMDSSPERHSMHSAHSVLSSALDSPAYGSMDLGPLFAGPNSPAPAATAAATNGCASAAVAAAATTQQAAAAAPAGAPLLLSGGAAILPRPPLRFWVHGLGGPPLGAPLADWLDEDEDDVMGDCGLDANGGLAIPVNPFAARTTLLHRPITSLTSLSAFRPSTLPRALVDRAPVGARPLASPVSPQRQGAPLAAGGGEGGAARAQAGSLASLGARATAVTGAGAGAGAAVASLLGRSGSPSQQQQQEVQTVQPQPGGGAEAGQQLGEGAAAPGPLSPADAAAVSQLLATFLQDLGLQDLLHIAPGPARRSGSTLSIGAAAAPASEATLRSYSLRGGAGLVELRWWPRGSPATGLEKHLEGDGL